MDTIKIRPVNLYRLSQITEKNDTSIEFCKYVGLIPKQVNCPTCSAILEKPYYIKNRNSQHKLDISAINGHVEVVEKEIQ